MLAAGTGGVQALAGALHDELPDELGQGREDVEDQPTARSGGVQRLVQGPEPDPCDRMGNGGAGVVGHADFSTRFSGSRRLPEVRIGARLGGV
jgi:hypothetical protein